MQIFQSTRNTRGIIEGSFRFIRSDVPTQVSEEEKHRRSQILIAEKNRIRDEILDALIGAGEPLSVVVETVKDGAASAHAENFAELRFPSQGLLHGEVCFVRPLSHADGVIFGEIIKK